jgi:NAD(P)-dependent dehydrogenase (short-subunit alcohol dehydrogenase family)
MVAGKKLMGLKAIVTGGAQGIGEAIAKTLALDGARVAIADINLQSGQRVASEIEKAGGAAWAVRADLTNRQEVTEMVKKVLDRCGDIDILVNNAGGLNKYSPVSEIEEEEWDRIMAVNLKSSFLCSQAVARHMIERRKGKIINIGSIAGSAPNPYAVSYLPYGVAKAGVIVMTKYLAKELGPYGITVNTVSPSTTITPGSRKFRNDEAYQKIADQSPMRHLVEPRDIAEAVLFLASESSRYVTGVNLNVNAGALMI